MKLKNNRIKSEESPYRYRDHKHEDHRYQDYDHNKDYQEALSTQIALQEYKYMLTFRRDREEYQYRNENGTLITAYVSFEELKSLVNELMKRFNYKILGNRSSDFEPMDTQETNGLPVDL